MSDSDWRVSIRCRIHGHNTHRLLQPITSTTTVVALGNTVHVNNSSNNNNNNNTQTIVESLHIQYLPTQASKLYSETLTSFSWTGELRTILIGTRATTNHNHNHNHNTSSSISPIHLLRGFEDTLIRYIYSFYASEWASHVKITLPASCVGRSSHHTMRRFVSGRQLQRPSPLLIATTGGWGGDGGTTDDYRGGGGGGGYKNLMEADDLSICSRGSKSYVSFASCGQVMFPEPNGRDVRMMPFLLGRRGSLPIDLQGYYDCIQQCPYGRGEEGMVGYLTVIETSGGEEGEEEERKLEGLRIERKGVVTDGDSAAFTPGTESNIDSDYDTLSFEDYRQNINPPYERLDALDAGGAQFLGGGRQPRRTFRDPWGHGPLDNRHEDVDYPLFGGHDDGAPPPLPPPPPPRPPNPGGGGRGGAGGDANRRGGGPTPYRRPLQTPDVYEGGSYYACNRSQTSTVYNALIDSKTPGIINSDGRCEHLRDIIGPPTYLEANELIWMTERTPFEIMGVVGGGGGGEGRPACQIMKVVIGNVETWYSGYFTANPMVPLPEGVRVVEEDGGAEMVRGEGGGI